SDTIRHVKRDHTSPAAEAVRQDGDGVALDGVTVRYGTGDRSVLALDDVTVSFGPGTFTAVMGPSGSGKSTLMACMSGLLRPDEGRVTALNQDLWKLADGKIDRFRLDHCGFVFQGFNLFPAMTALQQVEVVLKYQGVPRGQARERASRALNEVGLKPRIRQRPSELSGGEKQRVAIARALAKSPQLIFADEPTSALDGENGQIVMKLLHRAAKEHGAAVICVTHDVRLEVYADRVIHLEDGKILESAQAGPSGGAPALTEA
ncbi:MAG: ABC transporter ATP-binding protein, partial [Trebonia sp.]